VPDLAAEIQDIDELVADDPSPHGASLAGTNYVPRAKSAIGRVSGIAPAPVK
jgi:hypothetical protein